MDGMFGWSHAALVHQVFHPSGLQARRHAGMQAGRQAGGQAADGDSGVSMYTGRGLPPHCVGRCRVSREPAEAVRVGRCCADGHQSNGGGRQGHRAADTACCPGAPPALSSAVRCAPLRALLSWHPSLAAYPGAQRYPASEQGRHAG
jgi:hypothetical protein